MKLPLDQGWKGFANAGWNRRNRVGGLQKFPLHQDSVRRGAVKSRDHCATLFHSSSLTVNRSLTLQIEMTASSGDLILTYIDDLVELKCET